MAWSAFSKVVKVDHQSTSTHIYPNPANSYIIIEGLKKVESVNLINMAGQIIRKWRTVPIGEIDVRRHSARSLRYSDQRTWSANKTQIIDWLNSSTYNMTTINGFIRSYSAAVKRSERAQQRRARESARLYKQQPKQQEIADSAKAVADYNEYIDVLKSVHKDSSRHDWLASY